MMPFDFSVLETIKTKIIEPVFLTMSDGTSIATYSAIAKKAKAILIFLHGGGFYSGPILQKFANDLADQHSISVKLVDVRGHGRSSGAHGDAPSKERVWDDVSEIINQTQKENPSCKIFLGGHSSGAGLILNYADYKPDNNICGYLMIAPYLGHSSNTNKDDTKPYLNIVKKLKLWAIIMNIFSAGYFFRHTKALFFNYSDKILKNNPLMVDSYSCSMISAVAPNNAAKSLSKLNAPLAACIGSGDEQFDPKKVVDFVSKNTSREYLKDCQIISQAKHLDIILKATVFSAAFINKN